MIEIEECPNCGAVLTNEDLLEGMCPHCDYIIEEDTGDLLDDLDRDDTDKLGDVFDEVRLVTP